MWLSGTNCWNGALALLVCSSFQLIMADPPECSELAANYTAALQATFSRYDQALALTCPSRQKHPFQEFLCTGNSTHAQSLVRDFCSQVRSTGRLGVDLSTRCPTTTIDGHITFTPDVFLAMANLCEAGDPLKYIQILTPCVYKREEQFSRKPRPQTSEDPSDEWGADILAVPKGSRCSDCPYRYSYNRQILCRYIQSALAYAHGVQGVDIREACGQEALDVFREMRQKAMSSLNCSEFGDYVRTFKGVNVKYQNGEMVD